ncbi:Similar to sick: Protein sickie (Drosophila melanogaster) [Cotesia congregata]|uniref:Similar to sick: Protein sickie (Drosophila melanogaster) n=1 Tax=Cotesia congregata TaxID=51543 RepID=A0A8J2MNP1_COTCN|nr:Similar to sick: Protein sickie (Drosophila melanogaster) [Cotesia congregata]
MITGGLKHGNGGIASASSSRSTSPSQQPPQGLSFIPQPRTQNTNRQPTATTPSPRASTVGRPSVLRAPQPSPYASPPPAPVQNKNSVLDKFKLFNNKDKSQEKGKASSGVSKRTSSSSGFSSARSEHSDSSTSLCDQSRNLVESPKTKTLKSKLQSKQSAKQSSPKSGRKDQTKAQSKIVKKGSDKLSYPPLEDAKSAIKIANIHTNTGNSNSNAKIPLEKEKRPNNLEPLKQQIVPQKFNSALIPPGHQNQNQNPNQKIIQEIAGKISTKVDQKAIQRPKMELPSKINSPTMKVPVNGLNKDSVKGFPTCNGVIGASPVRDSELEKTMSMNYANSNFSEEKCLDKNFDGNMDGNKKTEVDNLDTCVIDNHKSEENDGNDSAGNVNANSNVNKASAEMNSQKISPFPNSGNGQTAPGLSPGSSIPKPMALVKGTTKPPKEPVPAIPSAMKMKPDSVHRKLDPNTVAMVSPMPSISDLMSESSHSNSNSTGQSNSSDSSVIYRPSSESGSDIKTIPNRKIDTTFEQMEKVSKPVLSDSCGGNVADDDTEMTVKPMQPLLRGYTPGARCLQTLPSRTTGRQYTILHSSSHHHVAQDYSDIDIASGYLSDGEVLRGAVNMANRTVSDLCDGYMSEGGASLYSRRINPSYGHDHDRYVSGSRRELSGVKELVSTRRVQKSRHPTSNITRDGSSIGCDGIGVGVGLLGGCSGGSDALAELTIEDLAAIPSGNHGSHHTGHPSHHKYRFHQLL